MVLIYNSLEKFKIYFSLNFKNLYEGLGCSSMKIETDRKIILYLLHKLYLFRFSKCAISVKRSFI